MASPSRDGISNNPWLPDDVLFPPGWSPADGLEWPPGVGRVTLRPGHRNHIAYSTDSPPEGEGWGTPPPAPARNKRGAPSLSLKELGTFQNRLTRIVFTYWEREERVKKTQVLVKMNMTEATFRTRLNRTADVWGCHSWEEILDYIISSKT